MGRKLQPLTDRFWSKVKLPTSDSGCWNWQGSLTTNGYGQLYVQGKKHKQFMGAHRLSFELHNGRIPDGFTIDHLCRNRKCVNPKHLEAVTINENLKRSPHTPSTVNALKQECYKGHPLSGDNLHVYKFKRICKKCRRESLRNWRAQIQNKIQIT